HVLRDAFRLDVDAAAALRRLRGLAEVAGLGLAVPAEAVGVAVEAADDDLLERTGAVPRALVVGEEDVAVGVEADAPRRAHAAGDRHELALRRQLHGPAAELAAAVERPRQAEGDVQLALPVEARAEGVLVVVAVDLPALGDDLEGVGLRLAGP